MSHLLLSPLRCLSSIYLPSAKAFRFARVCASTRDRMCASGGKSPCTAIRLPSGTRKVFVGRGKDRGSRTNRLDVCGFVRNYLLSRANSLSIRARENYSRTGQKSEASGRIDERKTDIRVTRGVPESVSVTATRFELIDANRIMRDR